MDWFSILLNQFVLRSLRQVLANFPQISLNFPQTQCSFKMTLHFDQFYFTNQNSDNHSIMKNLISFALVVLETDNRGEKQKKSHKDICEILTEFEGFMISG